MQDQHIKSIVAETQTKLKSRFLGKIFQLGPFSFVFDFGQRGQFLFISADPASPRFYLIERKLRDLEKQSIALGQFGQLLRSRIGGAALSGIEKDSSDRVVRMLFSVEDETGDVASLQLIIQLTGRAANLFLSDEQGRIIDALRPPKGRGQQVGETYISPPLLDKVPSRDGMAFNPNAPSEAADAYFSKLDATNAFLTRVGNVRANVQRKIARQQKLLENLRSDLAAHGDPAQHKRLGDLLLANVTTAQRDGTKLVITDYYSEGSPPLEIVVDENSSVTEEANRQFKLYSKAKRAQEEIRKRTTGLNSELAQLYGQLRELERIIETGDEKAFEEIFKPAAKQRPKGRKADKPQRIPGVRSYVSSDGYEVLVGRAAKDNDNLTFRVAKPHDLWLHAGDYPGSHVVVRNPTRKEIPQRTLIEAAQLAAHFSQASEDAKVVIHYTERKYLSKPKGAAPGLVRLSSFRSITVEPKESIPRLEH